MDEALHTTEEYRREQLAAYVDGELPVEVMAAIEEHLERCPDCRRALEDQRMVRSLLRAMPAPPLPRSFVLPLEGEIEQLPGRVVRAPEEQPSTGTGAPSPEPAPLPVRAAARSSRRSSSRVVRAGYWLGSIAAVLGFVLFFGTMVLGSSGVQLASSATSGAGGPSQAPSYNAASAATVRAATATARDQRGGSQQPNVQQSNTPQPERTSSQSPASTQPGADPRDILRAAAIVLVVAGLALVLALRFAPIG